MKSTNHSEVCLCDKSHDHKQIDWESSLIMAGNIFCLPICSENCTWVPRTQWPPWLSWCVSRCPEDEQNRWKIQRSKADDITACPLPRSTWSKVEDNLIITTVLWCLAPMKNRIAKFSINFYGVCGDSSWFIEQPAQPVKKEQWGMSIN